MNIFTNRDIRNFFILIVSVLIVLTVCMQIVHFVCHGFFSFMLMAVSLIGDLCIVIICFLYFLKQNKIMEDAVVQINHFMNGDTNSRIECDYEGSLYKLFHAVNTLATTLNAHAFRELGMKEFLKDTISDISHQLKTPLSALAIYNSLLQNECDDSGAVMEFALKSEREIDCINSLVQSLLKITRLDAGSVVMEMHTENIADIMGDVCCHFEARAEIEQKSLSLSGPGNTTLFCDRGWLTEAVSNLVKNAFDHTLAGGSISVEWQCLPAVTQIKVSDDGCGIHPEDIHHIFKRFYRSCFAKDTRGTGLGLPLAKAIAEAHGGSITVDSILGKGSVFVINLLNLTEL